MKKHTILSIFCTFFVGLSAKNIIFDLGGVLVSSSKFTVAREIGLKKFASYLLRERQWPQEILKKSLEILNLLEPCTDDENEPYAYLSNKCVGRIPSIQCKWLAGLITSDEIKKRTLKKIDELDELSGHDYFSSPLEKKLIRRTIKSMFNPRLVAHATKKIKQAVQLVKDLKAQGHELYILSNWDKESFALIYHDPENQSLFSQFKKEHVIISAQINDYKPHASAFLEVLKLFDLDETECIFIDDQEENIAAAEKLGIKSFHLRKKRYKKLRVDLKKQGIL